LTVALRNRSRNDKRSSGIINKNRIHLIHNRKVKFTLNKFVWWRYHIISKVVKAKLIVCSISNIRVIGFLPSFGVRLMIVYTVNGKLVELIQWAHPRGVTLSQIVIYCNYVYPT